MIRFESQPHVHKFYENFAFTQFACLLAALSVTFSPNAYIMHECSMSGCHLYHKGTAAEHSHMQQTNTLHMYQQQMALDLSAVPLCTSCTLSYCAENSNDLMTYA